MNILIINPRAHRALEIRPHMMVENGGILSAEDVERWACDLCMAPLDPSRPIKALDNLSLCPQCLEKTAPEGTDFSPCTCAGCAGCLKFRCPSCGGGHFGRYVTTSDGRMVVSDDAHCHDEHKTGCNWVGDYAANLHPARTKST